MYIRHISQPSMLNDFLVLQRSTLAAPLDSRSYSLPDPRSRVTRSALTAVTYGMLRFVGGTFWKKPSFTRSIGRIVRQWFDHINTVHRCTSLCTIVHWCVRLEAFTPLVATAAFSCKTATSDVFLLSTHLRYIRILAYLDCTHDGWIASSRPISIIIET